MNIEQHRAAFEAWASEKWMGVSFSPDQNNCGLVVAGRYKHTKLQVAWEAYQAAQQACLSSPEGSLKTHTLVSNDELQALRDALQEVVDAADGDGWNVLDASLEKQRAALAAMEKQK